MPGLIATCGCRGLGSTATNRLRMNVLWCATVGSKATLATSWFLSFVRNVSAAERWTRGNGGNRGTGSEILMREWIQCDLQLGRKNKKAAASIFGKIKRFKKTRCKTAQIITERNLVSDYWVIMRCWCLLMPAFIFLMPFSNVSLTELRLSGHHKYLCSRILALRSELPERSHFIGIFIKMCIIRSGKPD